jgi:hypothetical protein
VSYPWESESVVSEVVELRQLCDHLLSIGDGEQSPLDPAGEALIEYYGWDTQLSFDPWERYPNVDRESWAAYQCMLLDDAYAIRWDALDRTELYDVASDFEQTTDVASEHPGVVESYRERIEDRVGRPSENHERYRASGDSPGLAGTSESVRERLEDLGYTG